MASHIDGQRGLALSPIEGVGPANHRGAFGWGSLRSLGGLRPPPLYPHPHENWHIDRYAPFGAATAQRPHPERSPSAARRAFFGDGYQQDSTDGILLALIASNGGIIDMVLAVSKMLRT